MDAALLMSRFDHSWQRATTGLDWRGNSSELRDQLLACYAEPHRRYHTQQHLAECLEMLEPVLELAEHPAEVEMALWFHDAVYETRRRNNETQSAHWAQRAMHDAGVAAQSATRVHDLVMATRHNTSPGTPDASLLVDVDLVILGAMPERFAEYEQQIRAEYAFVPGLLFWYKRRAILGSFLQREHIYGTPHFRTQFEARARHNLQIALGA